MGLTSKWYPPGATWPDSAKKREAEPQAGKAYTLVEAILSSLDKPDPDIEKNWIAESEARYDAYKRGELKAVDLEEVKKRYEG